MKYLVTGATGNIGSRLVELLLENGHCPRVFVRNEAAARSQFGGRVEIFEGDLAQPESLKPAMAGAEILFLINSGSETAIRDQAAAELARAAGITHVVKLSALSAAEEIAIGAWHAHGEAAIRASGIPFTFLRPAGFMSNALEWARSIKTSGSVRACTGNGRVAYIHPVDIAEVAARVLMSGAYKGETLPITGPVALSYAEMTDRIAKAIGKPLTFHSISEGEARKRLTSTGMSTADAEALVCLWGAIREGRLSTANSEVERVLGRKPTTFDQWVQENVAAFS